MQRKHNSIADALELCLFCIKASISIMMSWVEISNNNESPVWSEIFHNFV